MSTGLEDPGGQVADLVLNVYEIHSLIKSHPFMDGTKRTALLSALWFLKMAGHSIRTALPHEEVVAFCMEVAEESLYPDRQPRSVIEIAA